MRRESSMTTLFTVTVYSCTLVYFGEHDGSRFVGELYTTRKEAEAGAVYPVKALRIIRDRRLG